MTAVEGLATEWLEYLVEQHKESALDVFCNKCPTYHLLKLASIEFPDDQRVPVVFHLFDVQGHKLKVFIKGLVNLGRHLNLVFGEVAEDTLWEETPIKQKQVLFGRCDTRRSQATFYIV